MSKQNFDQVDRMQLGKAAASRPAGKDHRKNRLAELQSVLQEMTEKEFTGHIKINFSQGGIGRIEKYEEILRTLQQKD